MRADAMTGANFRPMTVRKMTVLVIGGVLLAGCGAQSEAASPPSASSSSASSAAPTTTTDPYDVYARKVTTLGLVPQVQRGEAVSVAGNTCDNTVADMSGLIDGLRSIYPQPQQMRNFVTDRSAFIDAYCPSVRPVFDAAAQKELGFTASDH